MPRSTEWLLKKLREVAAMLPLTLHLDFALLFPYCGAKINKQVFRRHGGVVAAFPPESH
jgi:hypothetical protein